MSIVTRPVPSIQSFAATSFSALLMLMPLAVPLKPTRPVAASASAEASMLPPQTLPCSVVTRSKPPFSVASMRAAATL